MTCIVLDKERFGKLIKEVYTGLFWWYLWTLLCSTLKDLHASWFYSRQLRYVIHKTYLPLCFLYVWGVKRHTNKNNNTLSVTCVHHRKEYFEVLGRSWNLCWKAFGYCRTLKLWNWLGYAVIPCPVCICALWICLYVWKQMQTIICRTHFYVGHAVA
jgi:hypothetical protein